MEAETVTTNKSKASAADDEGFKLFVQIWITHQMVEDYGKATGDRNPLHFDDEFAREIGFKEAIAHGGLVMGIIGAALTKKFGEGVLPTSFSAKLRGPVYIGNAVQCYMHVRRKRTLGRRFLRVVDIEVRAEGKVLLRMNDLSFSV